MEFIARTVRSAPGLSQEAALESLQSHPNFKRGTKIASLRRRADRWVAVLHIPKFAEFPPSDEGGDSESEAPKPKKEAPSEDSGDDIGAGGPPIPGLDDGGDDGGDDDGDEGSSKGGTDEQMLHVLTEILHALKGGPSAAGIGGPDDLGPGLDGPPAPAPHGGPMGGPGIPGGAGAKLKPGEVPNKPGITPLGAPAFASVAQHPLAGKLAKLAGRKRTIPVSSPDNLSIKQAKADLDRVAQAFDYKVAQVRYCDGNCTCGRPGSKKIHALLVAQ